MTCPDPALALARLARLLLAPLGDPRAGAVVCGGVLGALAWAMARFGDERAIGSGAAGLFATVMVLAGGAAFVCHAADRLQRSSRSRTQAALPAAARGWIALLGLSCLAAIEALGRLG